MNLVKPVVLTTPDGVDRELRFTLGARKRIVDRFGMDMQSALNKYDSGAYPEILFALMHDSKGQPPVGVSVDELSESLAPEDGPEILAAILSAASQGKKTKNELEPLIRAAMDAAMMQTTGSTSGASPLAPLDSPTNNSGGDILTAKSLPESNDGSSSKSDGNAFSEP